MGHQIWPYKQRQTHHVIQKLIKPRQVREHTSAHHFLTLKSSPLAENLENVSLVLEIFTQKDDRNPFLLNDVINTLLWQVSISILHTGTESQRLS